MDDATKVVIGTLAFIFVVTLGVTYGVAAMEARAYNRITGSNVRAWDAVWVELRVDCDADSLAGA